MTRAGTIATGYALLATMAGGALFAVRGAAGLAHPEPWVAFEPRAAHEASLALGALAASLVVAASRFATERTRFGAELAEAQAPFARSLGAAWIVPIALLSSTGEELLFRALAQPFVGCVAQAVLFGLVHHMPGRAGLTWRVWAAVVGLVLGAIYAFSGSLAGPLLAHAVINAANLAYLARRAARAPRRRLEGLLVER